MTSALLIQAIVQQTMIFVAQLATVGRDRSPLASVSDQVFLSLTEELRNHGVRHKVIADMFGLALRTYHRRVKSLTEGGVPQQRTLWAAVLEYVQERQPVAAAALFERFQYDEPSVLTGVLNELTDAGCVYRTGKGRNAVYRVADQGDFTGDEVRQRVAQQYMVWLAVYRSGPIALDVLGRKVHLAETDCQTAVDALLDKGAIQETPSGYTSNEFVVETGDSSGWEAAVLDHYQAMVSAVLRKLRAGVDDPSQTTAGGTTYSFDVPVGHPLETQVLGLLGRIHTELDTLRDAVDAINRKASPSEPHEQSRQVVFYAGQYIKE